MSFGGFHGLPAFRLPKGPSLALNLLAGPLDSRITFTRSTTATLIGSNGLIQSAAINAPRFDYDPVTLAAKGLLMEESRTNVLVYSRQYDDTSWLKTGVAITSDATTAPDGTVTADKLVGDATTGQKSMREILHTTPANTTATGSFYAKAGEVTVAAYSAGGANGYKADFDLVAGTTSNVAGGVASMVKMSNGWYRCIFTCSPTSPQVARIYCGPYAGYTGDGTSGLYIWGAQLELGNFATSYIPTASTTITRAADTANMTETNFSDWFNAEEGSLISQFDLLSADALTNEQAIVTAFDGASDGYTIAKATASIKGIAYAGVDAAVLGDLATGVYSKGVVAYARSDNAGVLDGGAIGVISSSGGEISAPTQLSIGSKRVNQSILSGHVKSITYYPRRLTNSELQAVTK